jgi:hypothetical protein
LVFRKPQEFYLGRGCVEYPVARFGIDIWMTTEAVANISRSARRSSARRYTTPRPGGEPLRYAIQVVVTLFNLTEKHSGHGGR